MPEADQPPVPHPVTGTFESEDPLAATLTDSQAFALASLLPLMICGEDSAESAFAHHGRCELWEEPIRRSFAAIERDENRHARWLRGLQSALPFVAPDLAYETRVRRFFRRMGSTRLEVHLARIASLDSAVCQILGRLRRTPALQSAPLQRLFSALHRDEARHVAISRR